MDEYEEDPPLASSYVGVSTNETQRGRPVTIEENVDGWMSGNPWTHEHTNTHGMPPLTVVVQLQNVP